jgi:glyoxylase I family protein
MKIHIREIDHVVIRVADLESITRFYCDVLGCSVEKEQRDIGLIQLRAGRSLIDLLKVGAKIDRPENGTPGEGRNMDHLCVRYGADGFGPSLYLFDPEGNMVELKGPPEGAV